MPDCTSCQVAEWVHPAAPHPEWNPSWSALIATIRLSRKRQMHPSRTASCSFSWVSTVPSAEGGRGASLLVLAKYFPLQLHIRQLHIRQCRLAFLHPPHPWVLGRPPCRMRLCLFHVLAATPAHAVSGPTVWQDRHPIHPFLTSTLASLFSKTDECTRETSS